IDEVVRRTYSIHSGEVVELPHRIIEKPTKYKKVSTQQKNELKCTECEFRTQCASSWVHHLRFAHSTNLKQLGYLLRCDCGHESADFSHSYKCDISNFTVI
ncbi:hypothetical protein PMAYCL1PPCAC_13970, partial [Pristionchus mayeri]